MALSLTCTRPTSTWCRNECVSGANPLQRLPDWRRYRSLDDSDRFHYLWSSWKSYNRVDVRTRNRSGGDVTEQKRVFPERTHQSHVHSCSSSYRCRNTAQVAVRFASRRHADGAKQAPPVVEGVALFCERSCRSVQVHHDSTIGKRAVSAMIFIR